MLLCSLIYLRVRLVGRTSEERKEMRENRMFFTVWLRREKWGERKWDEAFSTLKVYINTIFKSMFSPKWRENVWTLGHWSQKTSLPFTLFHYFFFFGKMGIIVNSYKLLFSSLHFINYFFFHPFTFPSSQPNIYDRKYKYFLSF